MTAPKNVAVNGLAVTLQVAPEQRKMYETA
jgi:hypothetical protein